MHIKSWINKLNNRYYKVMQHPSFFGISLVLVWGSIGSQLGGYKIITYDTYEEIEDFINKLTKRREYRGYVQYA